LRGRLAFMGKGVWGRLIVSLYSIGSPGIDGVRYAVCVQHPFKNDKISGMRP
jgi:hypothetical protein